MNKLILIALITLASIHIQGQIPQDTTYTLSDFGYYPFHCQKHLEAQYNVKLTTFFYGCISPTQNHQDSLQRQNDTIEAYYAERLGKNWLGRLLGSLDSCDRLTCNQDSIKEYTLSAQYGKHIWIPPNATQLNKHQKCYLQFGLIEVLQTFPSIKIELGIHCLPGNDSLAQLFAVSLNNYFVQNNIGQERFRINQYGSTSPANRSDPNARLNSRLTIRVMSK